MIPLVIILLWFLTARVNLCQSMETPPVNDRKLTATVQLKVRMYEGLRRLIAIEAAKNGRSLNSEIVHRLGQSFASEGSDAAALAASAFIGQEELMEKAKEEGLSPEVLARLEKGRKEPKAE
jgi:Arc-like DNA binding domain